MRQMMRFAIITTVLLLMVSVSPSTADDSGCEKFAWSLARDRTWLASTDKPTIAVGGHLAAIPTGAFALRLQPASEASFALPPEKTPKTGTWFGGAVWLPSPQKGGIYQVTLSDDAWLDIIQDSRFARSVGHTARSDCPGARKSVRLELLPVPFVLQLSGSASDVVAVAIRAAE
jgi:hypothetical protein